MTIQETYEFLWQVRRLENTIHRTEIRKVELESCLLPSAIRYDKDPVQTSPEDITGKIVSEISALEDQIHKLKQLKARKVKEIGEAIEGMPNGSEKADVEKTVLTAFFVGRLSMVRVAEIVHYSPPHIYRVRREAVQHLREYLEKR